ncbi:MAG: hypothetical protein GX905_08950 [Bacteroidales bacterium]|nr:hypothetical protein [Bacteroidales bacterium]
MYYKYKLNNGSGSLSIKGCSRSNNKLNTYDWLADVPGNDEQCDLVEVQFKNTRKEFFKNSNHIPLKKGDIVAVESSPGHDIGTVTLTGRLIPLQMKRVKLKPNTEFKRIYRIAKPTDLEKQVESQAREYPTMIRARQIAANLNLDMKIGDVEFQGDGNKAIFYYIADQRVDFRQLIKLLAEAFRVRIEMRQIGARQEAGRIGGIGPCGRELCCSTWMSNFVSVSTNTARVQDLSFNPQKLAGQCAKLKCCLNYELDSYAEAQKLHPSKEVELHTQYAIYYHFKSDLLNNTITYSTERNLAANLVELSCQRAFEVIKLNRRGVKPESLLEEKQIKEVKKTTRDLLEQESLTRFDTEQVQEQEQNKNKKRRGKGRRPYKKNKKDQNQTNNNADKAQQENNKPTERNSVRRKPSKRRKPRDTNQSPNQNSKN